MTNRVNDLVKRLRYRKFFTGMEVSRDKKIDLDPSDTFSPLAAILFSYLREARYEAFKTDRG